MVAATLAAGTLVLTGGGVFAATRPSLQSSVPRTSVPRPSVPRARPVDAVTPARVLRQAPAATLKRTPAPVTRHVASTGGALHADSTVTYTIKTGDTLSGIAAWFKLRGYSGLYAANRATIGSDPDLIRPGERIVIRDGVMTLSPATRNSTAS